MYKSYEGGSTIYSIWRFRFVLLFVIEFVFLFHGKTFYTIYNGVYTGGYLNK